MQRCIASLAIVLLFPAAIASGQDRAVYVQMNGGATLPLGGVRDNFGGGWNLGMGIVFPVSETVSLQLDVMHTRVADQAKAVDSADTPFAASLVSITASHFMDAGTASVRFTPPRQSRRVKAYLLGGVGIYYRKVTLSSSTSGLVAVCNPWWFVCPGQGVTMDQIVGRRNSVGFGLSTGAGVACAVNDDVTVFLEARFHDIIGAPSFAMPGGGTRRATGKYLPVSVGVRF